MEFNESDLEKFKSFVFETLMKCVRRFCDEIQETRYDLLMGIGPMLSRLDPEESGRALRRLLLRRADDLERKIKDETEMDGWYYGELYPSVNRKILALLRIGYEFTGSDSEALFASLEKYGERFKENGRTLLDLLWDAAYHLDILLTLAENNHRGYDEQIRYCVSLLDDVLEEQRISKQLRSYMQWLIHRGVRVGLANSAQHKLSPLSTNAGDPLEVRFWVLFSGLEIDATVKDVDKEINEIITSLDEQEIWKWSTCAAFLAFASSVMSRLNLTLPFPYPTASFQESPFLGVVVETLLRAVSDVEKEKITVPLDENSLRNRFLTVLRARFSGLAYAESFRCRGQTDITVVNPQDHDEEVVIECKIWRGSSYYHAAIDQAIGYLTKRDSKVIIMVFSAADISYPGREKLWTAIRTAESYLSSTEGVVPLLSFQNNYLVSRHSRSDHNEVYVHHILTVLGKTSLSS